MGLAVIKVEYSSQMVIITLAAQAGDSGVSSISPDQFLASQTGATLVQIPCTNTPPSFKDVLQPGDILTGSICWNGAVADSPLRLEYRGPNQALLAAWEFTQAGNDPVPADIAVPGLKSAVHPLAESVLYQGLTVTGGAGSFNHRGHQGIPRHVCASLSYFCKQGAQSSHFRRILWVISKSKRLVGKTCGRPWSARIAICPLQQTTPSNPASSLRFWPASVQADPLQNQAEGSSCPAIRPTSPDDFINWIIN